MKFYFPRKKKKKANIITITSILPVKITELFENGSILLYQNISIFLCLVYDQSVVPGSECSICSISEKCYAYKIYDIRDGAIRFLDRPKSDSYRNSDVWLFGQILE